MCVGEQLCESWCVTDRERGSSKTYIGFSSKKVRVNVKRFGSKAKCAGYLRSAILNECWLHADFLYQCTKLRFSDGSQFHSLFPINHTPRGRGLNQPQCRMDHIVTKSRHDKSHQPTSNCTIFMLKIQWVSKINSSLVVWQNTLTYQTWFYDEARGTLIDFTLPVSLELITAIIPKM